MGIDISKDSNLPALPKKNEDDTRSNLELLIDLFRDSVEYVVEDFSHIRTCAFLKSNNYISEIDKIKFLDRLFVFNTIAEALLTIESQPDNTLYLCYIADDGGAGAHFSFFLKSNGNLISFSDRVDESYVGQHGHCRNGRWQEDKCYHIFPYDEVAEFEGEDYKGYPKYIKATTTGLNISELPLKWSCRTKLAALMLMSKYSGESVESIPLKFVHSLASVSTELAENTRSNELSILSGSQIISLADSALVKQHKSELDKHLQVTFSDEVVLSGKLASKYTELRSARYTEYNQDLVEAFGEGFKIDSSCILKYDTSNLLLVDANSNSNQSSSDKVSEYVADAEHFELEIYRQCREQLADYVQGKMDAEFKAVGGGKGVRDWYLAELNKRFDKLVDKCVLWYKEIEEGVRKNSPVEYFSTPISADTIVGYVIDEQIEGTRSGHSFVLNPDKHPYDKYRRKCPITGNYANVWFQIRPSNMKNVAEILDMELSDMPKATIGWDLTGRASGIYTGNSILDSTDPVARITHPFSSGGYDSYVDFSFTIGLSKRGINQRLKSL